MALSFDDAVRQAAEATITEHPADVERWLADEPGAWGALAGQVVIACRVLIGRRLSDAERRVAWQALWDRLVELRADPSC